MQVKEMFKAHKENGFCYNYKENDLVKNDYNGRSNWATWDFWVQVTNSNNRINEQNVLYYLQEYRYLDFLNELYPLNRLEEEDKELYRNIGMIDIVDIVNTYFETVEVE